MNRKTLVYIIFLICLGLVVYLNSLKGVLFWDDEVTVINNVFIRHPIGYLGNIFSTSYHTGGGETLNFYRPLATLSFALDYQTWGLNPLGYHLSNVVLHILNGIFIFVILRKIFGTDMLSLFSASLFLVHPINTEAVNYVSNRTDLLMLFFFLAAFYFYVLYRQKGKWPFLLGAYVSYLFSILSKEMGLVLPLFLLTYEFIFFNPLDSKHPAGFKQKRKFVSLLGFAVILAVYVVLRATVFNFLNINLLIQGAQVEPYSRDIIFRFLVFAKSCLIYLKLLFIPINLHMEYDRPYVSSSLDFTAWAALLFLLSLACVIFYFGRRKKSVVFGQLWFMFGLLPVSGIIPINTAISEHYLYLASIGFFILISFIILNFWQNSPFSLKPILASFGAVILITICSLTLLRNRDWQDPLKMYLDIIDKTKYSFRANNNAGVEYFRRGNFEEAERLFRCSLEILPTYAQALNNLGVIYEKKGEFGEAGRLYRMSIESKPDYLLAHKNLAKIYIRGGRIQEAKTQLQGVLKFHPYDLEAQKLLEDINFR